MHNGGYGQQRETFGDNVPCNWQRDETRNSSPEIPFRARFEVSEECKAIAGYAGYRFPEYKTVVFVNGCFWHGHKECKYSHLPSTNLEYWEKKIADNLERDERKKRELEELGYRVLTVWQCQLKPRVREENLERLTNEIISG